MRELRFPVTLEFLRLDMKVKYAMSRIAQSPEATQAYHDAFTALWEFQLDQALNGRSSVPASGKSRPTTTLTCPGCGRALSAGSGSSSRALPRMRVRTRPGLVIPRRLRAGSTRCSTRRGSGMPGGSGFMESPFPDSMLVRTSLPHGCKSESPSTPFFTEASTTGSEPDADAGHDVDVAGEDHP